MRRPGKQEAGEGREWWAVFAACAILVAFYLLVGLFRDVANTTGYQHSHTCNNTAQGAKFVTDDRGFLCRRLDLDADTGCCIGGDRYACPSCNLTAQCCASYEPCVSCCLTPSTLKRRIQTVLDNSANPILVRSAGNPFEFCRSLCRTSSDSVIGENRYRSELKYCYGGEPQPSGLSMLIAETEKAAPATSDAADEVRRSAIPTISVDPPAPMMRKPNLQPQHVVSAEGVAQVSGASVLSFSAFWLLAVTLIVLILLR